MCFLIDLSSIRAPSDSNEILVPTWQFTVYLYVARNGRVQWYTNLWYTFKAKGTERCFLECGIEGVFYVRRYSNNEANNLETTRIKLISRWIMQSFGTVSVCIIHKVSNNTRGKPHGQKAFSSMGMWGNIHVRPSLFITLLKDYKWVRKQKARWCLTSLKPGEKKRQKGRYPVTETCQWWLVNHVPAGQEDFVKW